MEESREQGAGRDRGRQRETGTERERDKRETEAGQQTGTTEDRGREITTRRWDFSPASPVCHIKQHKLRSKLGEKNGR